MGHWEDVYRTKLHSAEDAASLIPDKSFIVQGVAVSEPPAMLEAIANRARNGGYTDLRMTNLLPMATSARTILQEDVRHVIHWESMFASGADRGLVNSGAAVFNPAFFHQIPRLITEFMDVNVAVVCVSRIDKHGYMSLGTNVDIAKASIAKADVVIAEVNQHMPRVHGDSWVHISEVDAVVEHDALLNELPTPPEREEDEAMGNLKQRFKQSGVTLPLEKQSQGGVYRLGSRKLQLSVRSNRLTVRVGQNYTDFLEFLSKAAF